MTKEEVIKILKLSPLSVEGGWFGETYRAEMEVPKNILPAGFRADSYRASTSIYYLLGADDVSSMHALSSADETWHFHCSSSPKTHVKLVVASPDCKEVKIVKLGANLLEGEVPQFTIPATWMMGARISSADSDKSSWALCGATVAPSFEYVDFVKGDAEKIAASIADKDLASFVLELK